MKRISPFDAATRWKNLAARRRPRSVSFKSMIWIRFRFGFHRLARCPKCTPASIRSLTAIATSLSSSPIPQAIRGRDPAGDLPGATLLVS